jgi:lysozyme
MLAKLRVQLGRDEGYRRAMYTDSLGKPTIGIGHHLAVPISHAAVEQIFQDDLTAAEYALRERWPLLDTLSEARQGVCLNMAFNLGVAGFLRFENMIAALEAADYEAAADEMIDSDWRLQVGERAYRLARQMRTDQWV